MFVSYVESFKHIPCFFSDGVRLENVVSGYPVFVSGMYDADDMSSTSLTILMTADVMATAMTSHITKETAVTFVCEIGYMRRNGKLAITKRVLNVTSDGESKPTSRISNQTIQQQVEYLTKQFSNKSNI